MAEENDEVKIEINLPPKSIEIQTSEVISQEDENQDLTGERVTTEQPVMLAGGISQMTDANILQASPENVKFVMGPNGQLIAMQKPPFVWKDFAIGGGIPFALFFIPVLILMIGSLMGADAGEYNQIELSKQENGTAYQGEFDTFGEEEYLDWCNIYAAPQNSDYVELRCSQIGDKKAEIYDQDEDSDQIIGYFNGDNGTIYFDSGTDIGDKVYFEYEYHSEGAGYAFFMTISELVGFTCCLGLLLSIVFLIIGFSQGKPAMGWGGVSALLSFPIVAIMGLVFMW